MKQNRSVFERTTLAIHLGHRQQARPPPLPGNLGQQRSTNSYSGQKGGSEMMHVGNSHRAVALALRLRHRQQARPPPLQDKG